MTVETSTPTLADVFAEMFRAYSDGLRVALPAEVIAWDDAAPERAQVRPTVRLVRRVEGARLAYRPPILPSAPVAWPGSGAYGLTWPLEPGSTGLLVFADRSIDEWATTGQRDNEPRDPRRHAYADAVFIPGLRAFDSLPGRLTPSGDHLIVGCPTGGEVRLGSGSASDFVALSSLVEAQLSQINAAVAAAIAAANPSVPDSGLAAFTAFQSTLVGWPGPVASARVRSE